MKTEPKTKFTKEIVPKALSLLLALTDSLPVLILYIFTVLWYTVLNRAETFEILQSELFWSFRKFLAGDPRLGIEIAGNIIMFMPFGFLLCELFCKWPHARTSSQSIYPMASPASNLPAKRISVRKNSQSVVSTAFSPSDIPMKRSSGELRKWLLIPLLALSFSLIIESLQLTLVRGLAEADDLFTSTLGAILGICSYEVLRKLSEERFFEVVLAIIQKTPIRKIPIRKTPISSTKNGFRHRFETLSSVIRAAFVLICLAVLIFGRITYPLKENNLTRSFCFQVDEASTHDNNLTLRGFAFGYDRRQVPPRLFLRPTKTRNEADMDVTLRQTKTGNKADRNINIRLTETEDTIVLDVNYGAARPDVNEYFLCDYDYTNVGFTATGIVNPETEYEIFIEWPLTKPVSTGGYILGEDVHRVATLTGTGRFELPNLPANYVKNGTLLVCRPDIHIWVFQYDGYLYWVADEEFHFEDDGLTYIQYLLWTTQIEKLPPDRLKANLFWFNLSGYFEKYEISGDFGNYRVMRCELPTEYSITAVLTGYCKDGEWVWANSFRPVYVF